MKRYAICGLSARAFQMFVGPLLSMYASDCGLVGLMDTDPVRLEMCRRRFPQTRDVPGFGQGEFDAMVHRCKPDVVIVAGRDSSHACYIVPSLEHNIDVITEKPMVTTAEDCRRVLHAQSLSSATVTVTFNYRYAPVHRRIREIVSSGALGRVTSVDLNWYIDTLHGSSYFMRWNRLRRESGGLSVHKCCHHFDLVSWWIDQEPVEAFAYGALNHFGPQGEHNPLQADGRHCESCELRERCSYVRRWQSRGGRLQGEDEHIGAVREAETVYTAYSPDACIFDSEIDIEDTYAASVRFDGGAFLSYSAGFSCPYEGYRLAINGTRGRLETQEYHAPQRTPFPVPVQVIDVFPLFGSRETIHVVQTPGSHGGGDPLLLDDLFLGPDPLRPYPILAGARAGACAVALGEAVWRSAREGRPVTIAELLEP